MKNELLEKEDFEYELNAGLVAMFEKKHALKTDRAAPSHRVSMNDFERLKKIGPYFSPHDRVCLGHEIDIKNDGLPNVGFFGVVVPKEEGSINGYVDFIGYFPVKILPGEIKRTGPGIPYAVCHFVAMNNGGLVMTKHYVTVRAIDGKVSETYRNLLPYGRNGFKERITEGSINGVPRNVFKFCSSHSFCADRKYLWNVEAKEDDVKSTFGVYPEQIKSLFYARDLPMSSTGRKRPILHWVASHRRRIKQGTDVDISKYLRGIEVFEMNGTKFTITQPVKKTTDQA